MASINNAAVRVERDNRVASKLTFIKSLITQLNSSTPFEDDNSHLTLNIETHLKSSSFPVPPSRRAEFDTIGTDVWNISTRLIREHQENAINLESNVANTTNDDSKQINKVLCLIRVLAVYLLHAACEKQDDNLDTNSLKNSIRILKVCIKCSKTCIDYDEIGWATRVLEKTAGYVNMLQQVTNTTTAILQSQQEIELIGNLKNDYLILRVLLAWKQRKLEVAEHIFRQIDFDSSAMNKVNNFEDLVDTLFDIGKEEYEKKQYEVAIIWLERALDCFKDNQPNRLIEYTSELKCSILHTLIKTLMAIDTPEASHKAHNLMELMDAEFGNRMIVSLLKLEMIVAEKVPDASLYHGILLRLFRSIHLSVSNFKTVMYHLHKLREIDSTTACKALDDFLTVRLFEQEKIEFIERAIVMRIWITTQIKDEDGRQISGSLENFLDFISKKLRVSLSVSATHAMQTIFWKVVEGHMAQKNYSTAEQICNFARLAIFENAGEGNKAKIARKTIICALARNDLNSARKSFFEMSDAARAHPHSRFLMYKVALRSQDLELATDCLDGIANTVSKDATLLYACVLEAQRLNQKDQAIKSLQQVLEKYKYNTASGVHMPALVRVLAKLVRSELESKEFKCLTLLETYCRLYEGAATHASKSKEKSSVFSKDEIDWFSRTSYNFLLEMCSRISPQYLLRISNSCSMFLELLEQISTDEELETIQSKWILSQYIALIAYVSEARQDDNITTKTNTYSTILRLSYGLFKKIFIILNSEYMQSSQKEDFQTRHFDIVRFALEAIIKCKRWDELQAIFQECWRYDTNKHWQSLADLAFNINDEVQNSRLNSQYRDDILNFIKQIIQHAATHETPPILLARWIRTLFQIALTSATYAPLSISLIDQAVALSSSLANSDTPFPPIELEWLATTTFNAAIDHYSAGADDDARRWAEKSIVLAGQLADGGILMRLLQGKYARLTWDEK